MWIETKNETNEDAEERKYGMLRETFGFSGTVYAAGD